jgi:serine/threonine-protein kinase
VAIATIVLGGLAMVMSGAALWRTRHASSKGPAVISTTPPPGSVAVPDGTTKSAYVAGQALTDSNLKFKLVRTPSTTVGKTIVISQDPAPGTFVAPGTVVTLTISSGPPP